MAKFGRFINAGITIDGTDMSALARAVNIDSGNEILDGTAFGDMSRVKVAGMKDWSITIEFWQSFDLDEIDDVLWPLHQAGSEFLVEISPDRDAGMTTDNPTYSGTMTAANYQPLAGTHNDVLTVNVTLESVSPLLRTVWLPTLLADLEAWFWPEELDNPNRLLQTGDLENVAWTNSAVVTITPGQTDPADPPGSTAFLLAPDSTSSSLYQDAQGFQPESTDVQSIWIKRGPAHNGTSEARLRNNDGVSSPTVNFVPGVAWTRHQLPSTLNVAATQSRFQVYPDQTAGTESVYAWHPQLESGAAHALHEYGGGERRLGRRVLRGRHRDRDEFWRSVPTYLGDQGHAGLRDCSGRRTLTR